MSVEKIIEKMRNSPNNIDFTDLKKVCDERFGATRNKATSHRTYKVPGRAHRINIQNDGTGKAKAYQVRQVLEALDELGSN
ncbi:hypothetical protein CH06BL_26490 [Chromobacterium haemolyticum]|nr:hypothetical protein CH06BL_26490 [Chromobacterium haemolyticum]